MTDIQKYDLSLEVQVHDKDARCFAIHLPYIVTGSIEGVLKIFLIDQKEHRRVLNEIAVHRNTPPVQSLAVSDSGIIAVGHRTGLIDVLDMQAKEVGALTGHDAAVNSLQYISGGHLLSGSWDGSARIWSDQALCVGAFWRFHRHAVTVCHVRGDVFVTGSQAAALVLWQASNSAEPLQVIENAHSDIIREIKSLSDCHVLLSCSNDGMVKFWRVVEAQGSKVSIVPMKVDDDAGWLPIESKPFLFSVDALVVAEGKSGSDGSIWVVVGTESGSVVVGTFEVTTGGASLKKTATRSVWDDVDTVWMTRFVPDGTTDIVACTDNGVLRIFSTEESRWLPGSLRVKFKEDLDARLKQAKGRRGRGVDKSTLPDISETTMHRGVKVGQAKLFLDQGIVKVHQWSGSEWHLVGDMVDKDERSVGHQYSGDELFPAGIYDFIFTIELNDRRMLLPYNCGSNPREAAEKLCVREALPTVHVPEIAKFIETNAESQGASPTSPQKPQTFGSASAVPSGLSPLSNCLPIIFDNSTDWTKAAAKIRELNEQQEPKARLDSNQKRSLIRLESDLKVANFDSIDLKPSELRFLFESTNWPQWEPQEALFPFYDIWRRVALNNGTADYFRRGGHGPELFNRAIDAVAKVGGVAGCNSPLPLVAIRYLANLSQWNSVRPFFVEHCDVLLVDRVGPLLPDRVEKLDSGAKKNAIGAVLAFALNLAIGIESQLRQSRGAGSQATRDQQLVRIGRVFEFISNLATKFGRINPEWISSVILICGILVVAADSGIIRGPVQECARNLIALKDSVPKVYPALTEAIKQLELLAP